MTESSHKTVHFTTAPLLRTAEANRWGDLARLPESLVQAVSIHLENAGK